MTTYVPRGLYSENHKINVSYRLYIRLITTSSQSRGNSWYSPSKGQMDDGWQSTHVLTMINHLSCVNTALGALRFKGEDSQCSQMKDGQELSAAACFLISLSTSLWSSTSIFFFCLTALMLTFGLLSVTNIDKSDICLLPQVQYGLES